MLMPHTLPFADARTRSLVKILEQCYQKWYCILIGVVYLWSLSSLQAFPAESDVRNAIVRVTSSTNGSKRTGTGFIVKLAPGIAYILTASHVIEGDPAPRITFYGHPQVVASATVVGAEGGDAQGLALLAATLPKDKASSAIALKIAATRNLKEGAEVTVIGFPRGGAPWSLVKGIFSGRRGRDLIVDASIDEGSSGSPLIKDGLVYGLITSQSGFGRAVSAPSLQEFLIGWDVSLEDERVLASSLAGKWVATKVQYRGAIQLVDDQFEFKVDGGALTGWASYLGSHPYPIIDGKVDGAQVSFRIQRTFTRSISGRSERATSYAYYTGKLDGHTMRLSVYDPDVNQPATEMVAHRP